MLTHIVRGGKNALLEQADEFSDLSKKYSVCIDVWMDGWRLLKLLKKPSKESNILGVSREEPTVDCEGSDEAAKWLEEGIDPLLLCHPCCP